MGAARGRAEDALRRDSLRWRLPALISALIVVLLILVVYAAYREVEATLADSGAERARHAADQVAALFSRSTQQTLEQLHRTVPVLRIYLREPTDAHLADARAALTGLAPSAGRRITVWSATGARLLAVPTASANLIPNAPFVPAPTGPGDPGISPMQAAGDRVFTDVSVAVDEPGTAGSGSLGSIGIRAALTVSPPDALNRLVGADARILFGNRRGDVWTDTQHRVAGPALNDFTDGVAEYPAADRTRRIGAVSGLPGTPWVVWVEFPRSAVVSRAGTFLQRMTLFGLLAAVASVLLVRRFTIRVTTPLAEMTTAAEAIADGNFSRRIAADRRDEIGRLGRAFNRMTTQVADAYRGLEQRIEERTHELNTALAALHQRSHEREGYLATIVDSSADAIIGKNLNGTITSWNKGAEHLFGYAASEIVGTPVLRLIPDDRHDEERQILEQIKSGGQVKSFGTRRQTREGQLLDVSITVSPIRDATGAIVGASKVIRDIGESKRAADALREREEQLRLYAEHSPVAVAMFDRDMKYLVASRRWLEDFQLADQTIVGRSHYEVLPEIPPRWVEIHRRCLAGAVEKCDEDPFPRADGRTDWIRWEVRPWRRADGSIGGIIIFSEDVSERKHGEAALRASEDRYRTLFDCAPDGIVIANRESYYLDANASMCTMLGYTRDELIGMHASDIVAPTEAGHIGLALKTIDATSEYHREWQLRRKDGTIFPADVQASVTPDGNVMAIVRDVSERNRAIEAVSVLEQQYQQAQKMEAVGQLAGGVAHDFNNLLTAILGFGRLVLDTFPPDDQRRGDVEQIIQAGDRASALTRQLLAFSRKEMVQPVAMNLNELIVDTHKMVRRLIGEDIEVQLRLADDLGAVQADPGQVDQILVNLAVNARDAMPDGGRLTIETANVELDASFGSTHGPVEPGPYVMLAVADTGTGMTEDTRRRLFEPFFTTKARGKGTGLGLSTVFGIVKQNGGFLYVYSEPGQGAIFKIYFPRLAAGTSTVLPIPSAAPRSGSETVLLVEDEHAVRLLVRAILESAGYRVLEAANPPDAAASFGDRIGEVDLLVTDVIMPGGTGPALFAQLRSTSPRLRVLYISGYTDDATFRTGRLEPGVAFLQKPFAADVLLRKLREVLDSRHPQHDDEKAS